MRLAQYFDDVPSLPHQDIPIEFTLLGRHYRLLSDNGVFSKRALDPGTRLLLETIGPRPWGPMILDVGCGYGAIGLILAILHPEAHVILTDVNPRALALAQKNALLLAVASHVEVRASDLYEKVPEAFDLIVSNPPIRAGKKVTYALYDGAPAHLKPQGTLALVIRRQQGALSAQEHLSTLFPAVVVERRQQGYFVFAATHEGAEKNG